MTHIQICTKENCHYFLSCGENQNSSQILNALIHYKSVTSTKQYAVTYNANTNCFVVIWHQDNDAMIDFTASYLKSVFVNLCLDAKFLVLLEQNDKPGKPLEIYENSNTLLDPIARMLLQALSRSQEMPKIQVVITKKPIK